MTMRRGLFQTLYLRVLGLIAVVLLAMIALFQLYQANELNAAWRRDIEQEAVWTARHFAIGTNADAGGVNERLGRAWRQMHETMRLVIRNGSGAVLVDSHPEAPLDGDATPGHLAGRTVVERPSGALHLTLSRPSPPAFPGEAFGELLIAALVIMAATAGALYPLTRNLTRTFAQMSEGAERIAGGEFGARLQGESSPEVNALVSSFNTMAERLEAEERRRARLLTDVSHELRSPMGRLRALAETLARHPEESAALLAQVEAEIALMDRLVGDMLATARFSEGGGVELQRVAVRTWAAAAFERFRARVEAAGASFHSQLSGAEVDAAIDPNRLVQALGNLIDNALAAIEGRADGEIRMAFDSAATGWSLTVADNGVGLSPEDSARVLERFQRASPRAGAGLGLSIAKAIAEAHGGRICIDSTLGAGARVTLAFTKPAEDPHTFHTLSASAPQTPAA